MVERKKLYEVRQTEELIRDHRRQKRSLGNKLASKPNLFLDPEVDRRTILARRFQTLSDAISEDLGGYDYLSEAQRQLGKRAAMLSVLSEAMETEKVLGSDVFSLNEYLNVIRTLQKVFSALGIERKLRDITDLPSLEAYIGMKYGDDGEG